MAKTTEAPVEKAPEARPSAELALRRVRGGSSPMKVIIEGHILKAGPDRRIDCIALGISEDDAREAACSYARCWMANGMEEKARILMKTYGLDDNDIRSSSIPPAPAKG